MASVYVDIPGVGTVEAKNAATEATLREILKVMQGVQKNTGGGKGGSGGGKQTKEEKAEEDKKKKANDLQEKFNKHSANLNKAASALVGGFVKLGEGATNLIKNLANVGDSLESAAGVFSGIPLVGTMFSAVAGAMEKTNKAFLTSASVGATFNGSIHTMISSASGAGLTFDQFAGIIKANGTSLAMLGGTAEQGAKRFADLGKQMRNSQAGTELLRLGYSTAEINDGMARYTGILARTGQLEGKSNAELVKSSANYLKQMDALARITGETREEKQKEQEQMLADAAWRAKIEGMDANEARKLEAMVLSLPKQAQAGARAIIAQGGVFTDKAIEMNRTMPGTVENLIGLSRTADRVAAGQEKFDAQRMNQMRNQMAKEAELGKKDASQKLLAMHGDQAQQDQYIAMNELAAMKQDGFINALEEQTEQVKQQNQAEQVAKTKQDLAELSNSFMEALASSGILHTMLDAFKFLTDVTTAYVLPAFKYLGETVLPIVWDTFTGVIDLITGNLQPVFIALGVAYAAFQAAMIIGNGILVTKNILESIATKGLMATIAGYLGVNAALLPFALIAAAVTAALALIVWGFKKLGGDMEVLRLGFGMWWEGFKGIFSALKLGFYELLDIIPGLDFSEEIAETKADIKKNAETIVSNAKAINTRMAENRAKAEEEEMAEEKKRNEAKNRLAKGYNSQRDKELKDLKDHNKSIADERKTSRDLNTLDSTSLLKSELAQQNSALLPTAQNTATPKSPQSQPVAQAEASKKEIVAKAEKKQQEEEKKTTAPPAGGGAGADVTHLTQQTVNALRSPGSPAQESAESLLASLNSKLDQLIKVNKNSVDVQEKQLNVQRSFGGDLFASV